MFSSTDGCVGTLILKSYKYVEIQLNIRSRYSLNQQRCSKTEETRIILPPLIHDSRLSGLISLLWNFSNPLGSNIYRWQTFESYLVCTEGESIEKNKPTEKTHTRPSFSPAQPRATSRVRRPFGRSERRINLSFFVAYDHRGRFRRSCCRKWRKRNWIFVVGNVTVDTFMGLKVMGCLLVAHGRFELEKGIVIGCFKINAVICNGRTNCSSIRIIGRRSE